jgi:hypothetical protein
LPYPGLLLLLLLLLHHATPSSNPWNIPPHPRWDHSSPSIESTSSATATNTATTASVPWPALHHTLLMKLGHVIRHVLRMLLLLLLLPCLLSQISNHSLLPKQLLQQRDLAKK